MRLHQCPDGTAYPCEVKRLESVSSGDVSRDRITIATEVNDPRDDLDQLVASGVQIDSYMKNPVVGYNHNMGKIQTPIGRTEEIVIRSGHGLEAVWTWPAWEMDEDADKVHRLWDGRFLHAASIWFTILEARVKEGHEKEWWPPLVITSSVMREWALVYVPADSQAHRDRELFRMIIPRAERRKIEQRVRRRMNQDGTVAEHARSIELVVPLDVSTMTSSLGRLRGMTSSILDSFN